MTKLGSRRSRWLAVLVPSVLVACDSSGDKVGGQGDVDPITLQFAIAGAVTPDFVGFADDVSRRTGGALAIEFRPDWGFGEADYEATIIADVRAGTVDMAWVGVRAFDKEDVTAFQALVAPMLIDSQDLQRSVFEAGIPATMLAGIEQIGLAGIGVLPGPMRKVLGVDRPFVAPDDFAGAVVGIQRSGVAESTFSALGARTRSLTAGAELEGVDAYDQQFGSIAGNQYWRSAGFVTANLNLWPRPLAIFMNRDAFDALGADRQAVLRDAITAMLPETYDRVRRDDVDGAAELCRRGMTLAAASDEELAALRSALEPVYEALVADPVTAGHVAAIEAVKRELAAPPDSAECAAQEPTDPAASPAAGDATVLDGVYEVTTTAADLLAAGDGHPIPENWGDWVYVFDRGRFAFSQENSLACTWGYGTYAVSRDRVAWTLLDGGAVEAPNNAINKPGEFFVFEWEFDGDRLALSPAPGEIAPENFRAVTWLRTSPTPDPAAFSQRCPPPAIAFPAEPATRIPDGRYTRTATLADAERLGIDPARVAAGLGDDGQVGITFEISGDRWTHFTTSASGTERVGDSGTASYDEDGRWVTVSDSPGCPGCVLAYEWTLVGDTLTLTLVPTEFYVFHDDELFMTDGVYEVEHRPDR